MHADDNQLYHSFFVEEKKFAESVINHDLSIISNLSPIHCGLILIKLQFFFLVIKNINIVQNNIGIKGHGNRI